MLVGDGMQSLVVRGGNALCGEISVQGAKNSVLPILAGCVPVSGEITLKNCPRLSDVYSALRIMSGLGISADFAGNILTVRGGHTQTNEISEGLMREMRSSITFMGALLAADGSCRLARPGGCELGPRPIDMHLSAFEKMGVTITEDGGCLICTAENGLHGVRISLDFPSVGATENIILAALGARGETVIKNAAREPEIVDLAGFLNACGADIRGAGEGTVIINGRKPLRGCEYTVMPDRIAAGTYLAAAAATGGEILLTDIRFSDMDTYTPVFEAMGCRLYPYSERLYFSARNPLRAVRTIRTMPYPGFPTDVQAVVMAALCCAKGTSVFVENIFECRYKHVDGLVRMGADIKIEGRAAVVTGVEKLHGEHVNATDLRGGAALVVAALAAEGESEICCATHIDRGYQELEKVLSSAGASVIRKNSSGRAL